MKLIKVEAKGFKSFADRIILKFDGGVVGIVGPNGSGKSNINDAIRWVLGETSSKALRGNIMEDIIFAGSKTAPPMDYAEVSLTFDNHDQKSSLPHKKITITRILRRGAHKNEYYINGEVARLKDIKTISMETGMSKSSLAIISQGTIQDIAEATPEKRRAIFEEAAQVSMYKARKRESLQKLALTSQDLEKMVAITVELDKQVRPLKRQADKAKLYLVKYDLLKRTEVALIVEDLIFFSEKLKQVSVELEDVLPAKVDLENRIKFSENELELKSTEKLKQENFTIKLDKKLKDLNDRFHKVELQQLKLVERRKLISDGVIKVSNVEKIELMKSDLQTLKSRINALKNQENTLNKLIDDRKDFTLDNQIALEKLRTSLDTLQNGEQRIRSRISFLKDQKQSMSHISRGARVILENRENFSGLNDIVGNLIKVDSKFQLAVETVLKGALKNVVFDNTDDIVKAINFLKQNRAGYATFIPLDNIRPKGIYDDHEYVIRSQSGFVAIANEVVQTNPKYEILKKFLLGNVILVETIEAATNLSKLIEKRYMIVTLDGDLIRTSGVVSGGSSNRNTEFLGLDEKITELEARLPQLIDKFNFEKSEFSRLKLMSNEATFFIGESETNLFKIQTSKNELITQFENVKLQYESESKNELVLDETIDIASAEVLESEISLAKIEYKTAQENVKNINNELMSLTISKNELEKSLRSIVSDSSAKLLEKEKAEYYINLQRKNLVENYEMTIEVAREKYSLKEDIEEARKIVEALKKEIKALGNVNLDAIEAFQKVNVRYEKFKEAEEELTNARDIILDAISKMDAIIIKKLDATVKVVNKEINLIFRTMFGGGFAEIRYTDPKNLLETGIEVIAQPPGKTIKNLRLFSGGEKALVAISLLFAILKSHPLPLCILDEVEAALDESNVVRYANFLQELKKQTQFIVVTHRIGTMSKVDHLFGATMQKRGITSFFSVKLDDAKQLLE